MPGNRVAAIEESVMEILKTLTPEKKAEVLDFVEFIRQKRSGKRHYAGLKGLWSELGISITDKDISEVRREMWSRFSEDNA